MSDRYISSQIDAGTPGNMWDIIQVYAGVEFGITRSGLISEMMKRDPSDWPPKVLAAQSLQGVGSERWCRGYVNGAIRKGFLVLKGTL
jgi:hypothetical protein